MRTRAKEAMLPSIDGLSRPIKNLSAFHSPCFISHPLLSAPCQNSISPVAGLEPRAEARNDIGKNEFFFRFSLYVDEREKSGETSFFISPLASLSVSASILLLRLPARWCALSARARHAQRVLCDTEHALAGEYDHAQGVYEGKKRERKKTA